jgi:hypothetical protein
LFRARGAYAEASDDVEVRSTGTPRTSSPNNGAAKALFRLPGGSNAARLILAAAETLFDCDLAKPKDLRRVSPRAGANG